MDQDNKAKIGPLTAGAMLITALLFDMLQLVATMFGLLPTVVTQVLVLLISTPITIFAYLLFVIWFAFLGEAFFNIKKPTSFFGRTGGMLLEAVPFLTALPVLSGNVLFAIIQANGGKGFPASLVPNFLISITPVGKITKTVLSAANENKKEEKDIAA